MKGMHHWLSAIMSITVWLIGMVVIIGFLTHQEWMQNWMGRTPMAIETAICFVVTGVNMYLLNLQQWRR